ncbi:metal-dependent hydrolase [Xanthobacter autotrophicus]|uniref:metal-dependent hydrolase n=1 Tax=Xanthobacter autotrophicus TaxID=280 RepID=UPI0024A648C5|nr:metal-dependent hydrolase [Xanthobacter autotrophicus]MDI4655504.1 metal-dependent hydrolase [Xanthobacter autotrophicus]
MKITWFGHAAFRLDFADKAVLIDPFFTGNPSFNSTVEDASRGVTHILLTHGHSDHVGDTVSLVEDAADASRTLPVVANPELCAFLAAKGAGNAGQMMNTGGTLDCGGFTVTMVRADHSSGGDGKPSEYLGNPTGLIIRAPGEPTVWHMGDTDIFSDMALMCEIHRPKVVFIPIGDRFTMGPAVAALAVKRFLPGVEVVVPCHYGTFPILVQDASYFVQALADHPVKVVVPGPGGSFDATITPA